MGDNSRTESELLFLLCDTPTQCPLQRSSIMIISQRVIELLPAQYFITMGDNSRTQPVRVVILVCDTPAQCPLPIGEVS